MIGSTLLADGLVTLSGGTSDGYVLNSGTVTTSVIVTAGSISSSTTGAVGTAITAQDSGVPSTGYVRATLTSGSIGSGTTGSWLAMSSTRTWSSTRSSLGTTTGTLLLEFSGDSAGALVTSQATVTVMARITAS